MVITISMMVSIAVTVSAFVAHFKSTIFDHDPVETVPLKKSHFAQVDDFVDDRTIYLTAIPHDFIVHVQRGLEPERTSCLVDDGIAPLQSAVDPPSGRNSGFLSSAWNVSRNAFSFGAGGIEGRSEAVSYEEEAVPSALSK